MSKNDLLSTWASKYIEENNLIVHSIRMSQSHEQKREKLTKLLSKIQGLPAQQSHLLLELQVAYNCILLQRVTSDQQCPQEVLTQETHLVIKVLNRVCQLHRSMGTTVHREVYTSLSIAWEVLQHQPRARTALVWLLCAHSVHLLRSGELQRALLVLQSLSELSTRETNNPHEWSVDICLASGIFPTQAKPDVADSHSLINLLLAMGRYLNGKSAESLALLDKCMATCYQVPCQVLKAQVQHSLDDHEGCLDVLEDVRLQSSMELDSWQQAFVTLMCGVCLGRQGCHHSAIECYEQALQQNSRCLAPLYYIALAYQSLSMAEAEIEALTLLVKYAEKTPPSRRPLWDLSPPGHQLLQNLCLQDISYTSALYGLARRCLDLQKFSESSIHYLKLLSWLQNPAACYNNDNINLGLGARNKIPACQSLPSLPKIQVLFHETALALLRADQHDDAIIVCDHAIGSYSTNTGAQYDHLSGEEEDICPNEDPLGEASSSKKRNRSESSVLTSKTIHQTCEDLVALGYKCVALCKSEQFPEAMESLNLLISSTEKQLIEENASLEPQRKRIRLASESEASGDMKRPVWTTSLSQAYSCKAHVQWRLGKKTDALHNSRISIQLAPDNCMVGYNHSLMLYYIGKIKDAQQTWAKTKNNLPLNEKKSLSIEDLELSALWEEEDFPGAAILDEVLQIEAS